ncbi:MAG: class I SAM-dependent methyltransferase [Clostridia bacterium]|nr:class I SAM-dependent methyltransferase [Clostridia bacterium]
MDYQEINAQTIDRWVEEGWEWGKPISREEYAKAKTGEWSVFLTPTKPVPRAWFGELAGKRLLGLAAGGGQQMPVFAAAGADVTVLDYSKKQLETERTVAEREGYQIRIIRADMTKPLPFEDGSFDLIFHPVSNCYVREVRPIFRECFRILKPGGVLLGGYDNGINYLFDEAEERLINHLPFDPLSDPGQRKQLEDADCGLQFSHTLEEQLGGQLEAGFLITDLYEDYNGEGRLHELRVPSFFAARAVKPIGRPRRA